MTRRPFLPADASASLIPSAPWRIPIVIGVTGHRDPHPEAIEPLKAAVRVIFGNLKTKYRNTPLILLSPLSEGADRLVAEVALEPGFDARLLVPVSGQPESAGAASLLALGTPILLPRLEHAASEEIRQTQEWEHVGAYVARHSQILIALWDGREAPDSGTARVIAWQKEGKPAPFAMVSGPLDQIERGPVYHVQTPHADTELTGVSTEILYPEGHPQEHFESLWKNLDQYNGDLQNLDEDKLQKSRDYLLPLERQAALTGHLKGLFEFYASADEAAQRFQQSTYRTSLFLYALVAGAALCIEFYAHLLEEWWGLLVAYTILLAMTGLVHHFFRSKTSHQRYLDYRALAEALRVQFFWAMADLKASVADHYLPHFRSELDWIRQAVRASVLVSGAHTSACGLAYEQSLDWITQHWLQDQRKFFEKTAPQKKRKHHRFEIAGRVCFGLAVGAAIILLGVHLYQGHMNHGLAVAVFLLAVVSAMLHEWAEQSAYLIDAQRYQWMKFVFATAAKNMDSCRQAGDAVQTQELLTAIGKEALSENADWLIQHRYRPLAPPNL